MVTTGHMPTIGPENPDPEAEGYEAGIVGVEMDDPTDFSQALHYLFDEEPESQESRLPTWADAAREPGLLQIDATSARQNAVSEVSQPGYIFDETFKAKRDGKTIEIVESQVRTDAASIATPTPAPTQANDPDLSDFDIDLDLPELPEDNEFDFDMTLE